MQHQPPSDSNSSVLDGQGAAKPHLNKLTISRATIADLFQVRRLERKAFKPSDRCSFWMFLLSLVFPSSMLLVAKVDCWVVGHMLLVRDCDYPFANEISTIAVSFPFRRRGVARLLIESYSKEHSDRPSLTLQVRRSNEWAIHLYEKIGFEFSETLLGSYDDGEDGHVYIKHIGQSDEDIVA